MDQLINPHLSDEEFIKSHRVLSKGQSRKDHLAAEAEDGFDAAVNDAKRDRTTRLTGFDKIPGASRSGALDPQSRSRVLRREALGEIELQRDPYGRLVGYRGISEAR